MKQAIDLTIISTVFNEKQSIEPFLQRMQALIDEHHLEIEFILVDDGSEDGSGDVIRKIHGEFKTIFLEKNVGIGAAIKKGLTHAKGRFYCWIPSDGEIDPLELLKIKKLEAEDEIIITYFENASEVRSWSRHMLSLLFTKIVNYLFGKNVRYYNGISIIPISLYKTIRVDSNRFFFHTELLIKILFQKVNYKHLAIRISPRLTGKSKALKFSNLFEIVKLVLKLFWETRVLNESFNNQNRI